MSAGQQIFILESTSDQELVRVLSSSAKVQIFDNWATLQDILLWHKPDLMIMDLQYCQQPHFDEFSALQIPVIFLAPEDTIVARLQAVRKGGCAFFSRPLDMSSLKAKVRDLLGKESSSSYRILIIDNDTAAASYFTLILQQAQISTRVVEDPQYLLAPLQEFKPDMIFMGSDLPFCSDLELAAVIRQMPDYHNIPIIFLSSLAKEEYLTQPISRQHPIMTMVERMQRSRILHSARQQDLLIMDVPAKLKSSNAEDAIRRQLAAEQARRQEVEKERVRLASEVESLQRKMADINQRVYKGELRPGDTLPGTKGESYIINQELARGGMGVTYTAIRQSDNLPVVIKTLLPRPKADIKELMRFGQEARTILELDHPNLVRGYDFYEGPNFGYLIMEYIAGYPVDRILEHQECLPPRLGTSIALDIAKGLAYLEKRHLVHRDIKPANIIISRSGVAKLVDFGIVKMTDRSCSLTTEGFIVGSAYYLSPEQSYSSNVDIRSDIYSLGATYYHMVVGQLPFCGENFFEIVHKRMVSPVKPRKVKPDLPKEVARLIEKMMHRNIKKRHRSAVELLQEMQYVLNRLPPEDELPPHFSELCASE